VLADLHDSRRVVFGGVVVVRSGPLPTGRAAAVLMMSISHVVRAIYACWNRQNGGAPVERSFMKCIDLRWNVVPQISSSQVRHDD
jgi:hypothetical protein